MSILAYISQVLSNVSGKRFGKRLLGSPSAVLRAKASIRIAASQSNLGVKREEKPTFQGFQETMRIKQISAFLRQLVVLQNVEQVNQHWSGSRRAGSVYCAIAIGADCSRCDICFVVAKVLECQESACFSDCLD